MMSLLISLHLPPPGMDMFIPIGSIIVVTIIRQDLDDYLFRIMKPLRGVEPGSPRPTEQMVPAGIQQAVLVAHVPRWVCPTRFLSCDWSTNSELS